MHNSTIKASILTEALSLIVDMDLEFEEMNYGKEFLNYAKMVTERIIHENYFKHYLQNNGIG